MTFRIKNLESRIKLFLNDFLIALFFILIALFYSPTVSAQTSTQSAIPTTVSPTSPIYTDLLVHNLFHTFSCLSVGSSIIGQPCLTYQITQNAQGAIQSIPVLSSVNLSGGLLGTTGNLIGLLYANPPVRTVDYLASLGAGFGIVKEAKAQVVGSGAAVLNPILTLWQVSRNIVYLIMIIIFVIIGLMVMFRQRINPQTVITAQAALPGLVIGLILITFSYFLAALITDTAFIGTNLVGYYFSAAQGTTQQNLVADTTNYNVLNIFSRFTGIIRQEDVADILGSLWDNLSGGVQFVLRLASSMILFQQTAQIGQAIPIPQWNAFVSAGLGLIGGAIGASNPAGTVALAISIIAIFILIYSMIRLLLRLINNFLSIIFLVITAPFHFLAASLPGRQDIATAWILNMLCNVLAFPAVIAVFYFVNYLLGPLQGRPADWPFRVGATSGLAGANTLPLFGGLDISFVNILIAFGALVASPTIPDIICRTIGRVTQAGQLIGQEFGAGLGAGRGYAGQFYGAIPGAAGTIGKGIGGERVVTWVPGQGPTAIPTQRGLGDIITRRRTGKWSGQS